MFPSARCGTGCPHGTCPPVHGQIGVDVAPYGRGGVGRGEYVHLPVGVDIGGDGGNVERSVPIKVYGRDCDFRQSVTVHVHRDVHRVRKAIAVEINQSAIVVRLAAVVHVLALEGITAAEVAEIVVAHRYPPCSRDAPGGSKPDVKTRTRSCR
jgi:hypothetical protein